MEGHTGRVATGLAGKHAGDLVKEGKGGHLDEWMKEGGYYGEYVPKKRSKASVYMRRRRSLMNTGMKGGV